VQDAVETRDVGIEFGLPVVAFDLGGQRVPGQAEAFDEALCDLLPVGARNGGNVGGVGAGGAVDLAEVFGPGNPVQLPAKPVRNDGQFLAQGGGRGGLAVGAGEHRHGAVVLGHGADLGNQGAGRGQPHVLHGPLDAQGVGEVVDVFGGAAEVHHGGQVIDPDARQAAADVVLDGLDVVHRDRLDLGQFGDGAGVELRDDCAQLLLLFRRERAGPGQDAVAGQMDQPLNLHRHAVAVQGCFGKVVHQRRDGGLVAAIQRAERDLVVRRGEGQASGRRTGISCGGSFRHVPILSRSAAGP
jgi:hypothetical protein